MGAREPEKITVGLVFRAILTLLLLPVMLVPVVVCGGFFVVFMWWFGMVLGLW